MEKTYPEEIKKLIRLGFLEEALDTLEEWLEAFKNEELKQGLIVLQQRYNTLKKEIRNGNLDDEKISIERNRIVSSILDYCSTIEKLGPPAFTGKGEKGVLAHNIPLEMKKGIVHKCIVRIAQEEFVLIKDFSPTTPVKELSISDEMVVELIDIKGGAFEITTHSRKNQTVLKDEATEWIFYVKPVLMGIHTLNLKAAMITIGPDGREKIKEYTFENNITIETTLEISDEPVVSANWQALSNVFSIFTKKKKKKGLLSGLPPVLAKVAWATLGVLAVAIGILVVKKIFVPKAEIPIIAPKADVLLQVPSLRKPFAVFLNGDSLPNWQFGGDSATIRLADLETGGYQVKIKGANGSCSDSIFPSPIKTVFSLPCTTIPDSFTVTLLTPFDNFRLFVDDIRIRPLSSSSKTGHNSYETEVRLEAGNHIFRIQDRANRFKCDKMPLMVDKDKSLSLNCTIPVLPVQYYDVEIISPFQKPVVKIDNQIRTAKNAATEIKLGWKLVFRVEEGSRQFEVLDPNGKHLCTPISRNINSNSNRELTFTCRSKTTTKPPTKTTTVVLYVRGENATFWPELIDVVIDGSKIPRSRLAVRALDNQSKKNTSTLEIRISDVPYGKHMFAVEGTEGVYSPSPCPSIPVEISPNNNVLEILCAFNRLR